MGRLILRDDAVSVAPARRAEGMRPLQGERASARGWTLHKTLILVNVTCGVLILLGLLLLVLSGGEASSGPGK